MAAAAALDLPWPEAEIVAEDTLEAQTARLAAGLPDRPLVLGGCCCAHVGAIERLAARSGRLAVVWLDQHGDLNTHESSLSGDPWGMPLRMVIDAGAVAPCDVALIGGWDIDPPEQEFIRSSGLHVGPSAVGRALEGTEGVYVALDCDVLDPAEVPSHMPSPLGVSVAEVERWLVEIAAARAVLGAGITGALRDERAVEPLTRLLHALGL